MSVIKKHVKAVKAFITKVKSLKDRQLADAMCDDKKRKRLLLVSFPLCIITGLATGLPISWIFERKLWGASPLIGMVIGIIAYVSLYVYIIEHKGMEPGREHGEARFAKPEELLPSLSGDAGQDKVLSQNLHMTLDDKRSGRNASCLLIGGSGSGKTFRYVAPNLLQLNSSYVFTDPKGTLLKDYGNYLIKHGYSVKVVNLVNPYESDSFNPFRYIRSNNDIVRLVSDYIRATTPKNASENDPFWSKSEAMLETAIAELMFLAFPEDCTMERFLKLLNMLQPPSKDHASELDELFEEHMADETTICSDDITGQPVTISGQRAFETYMAVMSSAEDTCRSIIISTLARYDSINNSPQLIKLLSGQDTVDFRALGLGYPDDSSRKTALFIITSDIDKTFGGLALWILTSLYHELYASADAQPDGRLPIPVQLYLDEFANIPQNDNILQLFATARSRNVSITAIVQSQAQLKGLFHEEEEGISGAADTMLYMGSQEASVHKYISEQLGKYTLSKQSTSSPSGFSGSNGSRSTDSLGKELMSPDRVRLMPNDKILIMIRGFDPVLDEKYKTQDSPLFKEAMALGKFDYQLYHQYDPFPLCGGADVDDITNGRRSIIDLTVEELFNLPDAAFDYTEPVIDEFELALALKRQLSREQSAVIEAVPEPTTLDSVLARYDFSDAQLAECTAGIEAGLSEQQILSYFRPENSAERMRVLRLLIQHHPEEREYKIDVKAISPTTKRV